MMATHTANDQFEQYIDDLVCNIIHQGNDTLGTIVLSLPSVYPSLVLCALQRLCAVGRVPCRILNEALKEVCLRPSYPTTETAEILPIPHPLDYEWRFSKEAIDYLLKQCVELSEPQDTIAMLGVPSVFQEAVLHPTYNRRVLLIDSNLSATKSLAQLAPHTEIIHCDLLHGQVPANIAKIAIIDAPWYPAQMEAFLCAASCICSVGGYILMSAPPAGTRPRIGEEWKHMVQKAEQLGLRLVAEYPLTLSYVSPPFERNALRAEGITNYPTTWRRGDLAIFALVEQKVVDPPRAILEATKWVEYTSHGVRIRLREQDDTMVCDPTLISIIPGDILPSVSRRDRRRQLADVWTSGNRIFQCASTRMLGRILEALSNGEDLTKYTATALDRPLTEAEAALVIRATDQVKQLVDIERSETLLHDE